MLRIQTPVCCEICGTKLKEKQKRKRHSSQKLLLFLRAFRALRDLRYEIILTPRKGLSGYTATIPRLPDCTDSGWNVQSALRYLNGKKSRWFRRALKGNQHIPLPRDLEQHEIDWVKKLIKKYRTFK
jgi:hypothetical protein